MLATSFYKPGPDWVGDVIPYQFEGTFYLYYLHEIRTSPKPGTSWHLVTTTDFMTYTEHGEVLPHGGEDDIDFNCYTGSVITDDEGLHHLFYTGQNPRKLNADGRPYQVMMHATSTDLVNWTKHPEHAVYAPEGYNDGDWRDPFVFKPEPSGPWYMVCAGRRLGREERRSGVVATCVSHDLVTWEATDPIWDPARYLTQECPEVFQWGEWWYLVYSEFTDAFQTRYRMARSPFGPWIAPKFDTIDSRAFYAAKSAERDGRRFFIGWIASKDGETDTSPWLWAGTMAAWEATQNADGTLAFSQVKEIAAANAHGDAVDLHDLETLPLTLDAHDRYTSHIFQADIPARVAIAAELSYEAAPHAVGLLLRTSPSGEEGYSLRLEPHRGRLVFDKWPRPRTGGEQWQISGDVPFDIELERFLDLSPGTHSVSILLVDTLLQVAIDHQVVLSHRIYDHAGGSIGFFAVDGTATLESLRLTA